MGLPSLEVVMQDHTWYIALVRTSLNPIVSQREAAIAELILFFEIILAYYNASN